MAMNSKRKYDGLEIAVIGMSAQFPDSDNYNRFWENLKKGKEMIKTFSRNELIEYGLSAEELDNALYVGSEGTLANKDCFDSGFFGYRPEEAALMDPQIRLFHENCWRALEDAGYISFTEKIKIGLFAGASVNDNWKLYVYGKSPHSSVDPFYLDIIKSHQFISSLVSYKLNLRGPSFYVNTACSTSLTAVHLACRSLLTKECKIALAGGVSIRTIKQKGYFYEEGMISSKDGKVRTFDIDASGSVGGEGVGVVVLKRMSEAIADRDYIHAVIRSSAVNNDGSRRVGYAAPGVRGQAECIMSAHRLAGISPGDISYIEAHGTATKLGDSVEIQSLKEAFGTGNVHKHCAIGSVKTNIGHLDAAAGVAGLIKTVLSLKNRQLPPSLHFERPNPEMGIEDSPFYVNTILNDWKNDGRTLLAGVSSFGIGGTNAHVVLEEAPAREDRPDENDFHLILLSARTPSALEAMTSNLAQYLKENGNSRLSDICYTLATGRNEFNCRRKIVCENNSQAIHSLLGSYGRLDRMNKIKEGQRPVVFMFSGLGSQYPEMSKGLYETEPLFRAEMDRCFAIVRQLTERNIREMLYPENLPGSTLDYDVEINQYVIFSIEYALAKMLMDWGIMPKSMIGYSFGEYTAACIAGVFSVEDALRIIHRRSMLIKTLPEGRMFSIPLPVNEIGRWLKDGISLSIDNGYSCVVSGTEDSIDRIENELKESRLVGVRLNAQYAIHSPVMDPVAEDLAAFIRTISLHQPAIPYVSGLTGDWIRMEEASDPQYWAKQLCQSVMFSRGLQTLLKEDLPVFIEIGPGNEISALMNRLLEERDLEERSISLIRPAGTNTPDKKYLVHGLGNLWRMGVNIDWERYYLGKTCYRIPLPSYPFEQSKYPAEVNPFENGFASASRPHFTRAYKDYCYLPTWKRRRPVLYANAGQNATSDWLVFADEYGMATQLSDHLAAQGSRVVLVRPATGFAKVSEREYEINPESPEDYEGLFFELKSTGFIPDRILHLLSMTSGIEECVGRESLDKCQILGYYSLLHIAASIAGLNISHSIQLVVISNGIMEVTGSETVFPGKATILGPVKVIPQEFDNIRCRYIDLDLTFSKEACNLMIGQIYAELTKDIEQDDIIALRKDYIWVPDYEKATEVMPTRREGGRLKQKGVYLIAGGMGGVGLALAEFLIKEVEARVILIGRSPFPAMTEWEEWMDQHGAENLISQKISLLQKLKNKGGEILILQADLADRNDLKKAITFAEEKYGKINGVVHAATMPDGGLISVRKKEMSENIFKSKLYGTLLLNECLPAENLDFVVYFSALSAVLGGFGQVAYCAANLFLDAYAGYRSRKDGVYTLSINWGRWKNTGIARIAEHRHKAISGETLKGGLDIEEALECFKHALSYEGITQVVIAEFDIKEALNKDKPIRAIDTLDENAAMAINKEGAYKKAPRPDLTSEYIAPGSETETRLGEIWEHYFSIDKIGIMDNFFELGGDSLKAMLLIKRIDREFNINMPLRDVLANANICSVAARIDEIVWINRASEKKYSSII